MKQLDKLTNKAKGMRKSILFLMFFFLIGLIAGSLFITILNETDKTLIQKYLEDFFTLINRNQLDYVQAFTSSFITNIFYVIIIWLLGISVIGLPIILFLYFSKAFIMGFSISSILFHYKWKGILMAFIYVFPHHIINILLFSLLVLYSMYLSIRISKTLIAKKSLDFKVIMRKYGMILLISIIGTVVVSLCETFVMPTFMKFVLSMIK